MESSSLTSSAFWADAVPFAPGGFPGPLPDDPSLRGHVMFETSGSTGTPKWIALSKSALLSSAAAVNRHLDVSSTSCWGLALPASHVGGFGVAARAFEAACGFSAFASRWDARAFGAWLAAKRVTHTSLVPTQVHDLVVAEMRAPASLRAMVVGGGHLDAATGRAARALGWPVLASYGMTEAASQIATQGLDALQSIYQPVPLPLLPIWQVELSHDHLLRIAGPALFSGTLVRENDQWAYLPRTAEWHQTFDRVMLDHGNLTVIDRADSLIKVLGELVDPESIERELAVLSGGRFAPGMLAVIALADARAGHILVPVFEAAVDAELIASVLTAYAGYAPGFRRLRPPVIVDSFPRSPMGKARREELAALIRAMPATGKSG